MSFNIAIDGPAGAGKSTIAKKIAKELGFVYVDTGAMYRAMALYFLRSNISNEDEQAISRASENVEITIQYENGEQQVFLNGENVSGEIRKEEVGNMASKTSGYGQVRKKLVELQQQLAKKADVVSSVHDNVCLFYSSSLQKRQTLSWTEETLEPSYFRMHRSKYI